GGAQGVLSEVEGRSEASHQVWREAVALTPERAKAVLHRPKAGRVEDNRSFKTEYPANGSFFRPQIRSSLARAELVATAPAKAGGSHTQCAKNYRMSGLRGRGVGGRAGGSR